MAWDDQAQKRSGFVGGGRVEYGTYAFVTSAVTVELPTAMSSILMFMGVVEDDNVTVKSDRAITSQAVTVTRATGGTSGATFSYIMTGRG
jgi:hypothetical protein